MFQTCETRVEKGRFEITKQCRKEKECKPRCDPKDAFCVSCCTGSLCNKDEGWYNFSTRTNKIQKVDFIIFINFWHPFSLSCKLLQGMENMEIGAFGHPVVSVVVVVDRKDSEGVHHQICPVTGLPQKRGHATQPHVYNVRPDNNVFDF